MEEIKNVIYDLLSTSADANLSKQHVEEFHDKMIEWCKAISEDENISFQEAYDKHVYEALGILAVTNSEESLTTDFKHGKHGYDMEVFDKYRPKIIKHYDTEEDKNCLYRCIKKGCGAGCRIETRQTRRADEGGTNYAICKNINCGAEYKIRA